MLTHDDIHILAEQARDWANDLEQHWSAGPEREKLFEQKFTEYIVREAFAALWTDECLQSDLALEEFNRNVNKIKHHFGIEK